MKSEKVVYRWKGKGYTYGMRVQPPSNFVFILFRINNNDNTLRVCIVCYILSKQDGRGNKILLKIKIKI